MLKTLLLFVVYLTHAYNHIVSIWNVIRTSKLCEFLVDIRFRRKKQAVCRPQLVEYHSTQFGKVAQLHHSPEGSHFINREKLRTFNYSFSALLFRSNFHHCQIKTLRLTLRV